MAIDPTAVLNVAGLVGPIIGAGGALGYGIAHDKQLRDGKEMAEALARRSQILRGSAILRAYTDPYPLVEGEGQIAMIWAGTFPSQVAPQSLKAFSATGTGGFVGDLLWTEPDRVSLRDRRPHVPDEFRDRLIVASYPLLRGGFTGRTVTEVLDPDFQPYWLPDLQKHSKRWMDAIRHRGEPVILIVWVSPGPSGVTGWDPLLAFHEEHSQVPIYVVMVVDEDEDRAQLHLPPLLDLYGQGKVVKGFIIGHNSRNPELFDEALAALFPNMIQGALLEPRPKLPWNWLSDLFRYNRVATLREAKTYLAVNHLPGYRHLPQLWYTEAAFLRVQALRALQKVLSDYTTQSLPIEPKSKPQLVYITTPLRPDPEAITLRQEIKDSGVHGPNVKLFTVSMGSELTKDTIEEEVLASALVPIEGGLKAVKELALGKLAIASKFQGNGAMRGNNHAKGPKEDSHPYTTADAV